MFAKKSRTDLLFRRFAGQGFDAVLAKLEQMPIFVRARPSAALAIEPVFLINFEPIADAARESGFARGKLQTLEQSVHSGGGAIRLTQSCVAFFLRRLRAGRW